MEIDETLVVVKDGNIITISGSARDGQRCALSTTPSALGPMLAPWEWAEVMRHSVLSYLPAPEQVGQINAEDSAVKPFIDEQNALDNLARRDELMNFIWPLKGA